MRRWAAMYCLTPLAIGGFADVYRGARADAAAPEAAIKVLREPHCRNPRVRHRFARECEILAALDHPDLPSLIAAGPAAPAGAFLAYRYVPGRTLAEHLRDTVPCGDERADLADRLADGLSGALAHLHRHRLRLAHGDLAPRNILLREDGGVTLIDLGTALATVARPHDDDLFAVAQPAYLSPEQAQGQTWGTASDLYQLGLVLFEVLAGRRFNTGEGLRDCRLHAAAAEGTLPAALERAVGARHAALIESLLSPLPGSRATLADLND